MCISIPIVVIHKSNPEYLGVCLSQIRKYNPDNRIILLGDSSNRDYPFVEHFDVDDPALNTDIESFRNIYQHFSHSQTVEFERFCIERWILLRNLMRKENLSHCLHIDSDVLLFCSVDEESTRFTDYVMTFAHWNEKRNLVHCNFINNRQALEDFCQFIFRVYTEPNLLEQIKTDNQKRHNSYAVSDMSLFYAWSIQSSYPFCFFEDWYSQGIGFDACFDFVKGFQTQYLLPGILRPYKKLNFVNNIPTGKLENGQDVTFKCIHYHGYFKFLMKYHARGVHSNFLICLQLLRCKIKSLGLKLRKCIKI